jgi:hypothetical protein
MDMNARAAVMVLKFFKVWLMLRLKIAPNAARMSAALLTEEWE